MNKCAVCKRQVWYGGVVQEDGRLLCASCDSLHVRAQKRRRRICPFCRKTFKTEEMEHAGEVLVCRRCAAKLQHCAKCGQALLPFRGLRVSGRLYCGLCGEALARKPRPGR
jgi:recombinational DNA repair protein (RecF pathway)